MPPQHPGTGERLDRTARELQRNLAELYEREEFNGSNQYNFAC